MTQVPAELQPFLGLPESKRDLAIEQALVKGAMPPHLLKFLPVVVTSGGMVLTFYVSPDYIGIGEEGSYLRTPLPAPSLQRIVDAHDCTLPTARMVYLIYKSRDAIRVPFKGFSPRQGETRHSSRLWSESNDSIEERIQGRRGLFAGHKKDVVVGPSQMARPTKVAIFGAWSGGAMIQGLNAVDHSITYCDYSQCGRMVQKYIDVDGTRMTLEAAFQVPAIRAILTGEAGTIVGMPRYRI